MLYDSKRWDKKEPSLDGFIEWLEMQDPKTRYNPCSVKTCVLGQYAQSIGLDVACDLQFTKEQSPVDMTYALNQKIEYSIALGYIPSFFVKKYRDRTFGDALKRAQFIRKKLNAFQKA